MPSFIPEDLEMICFSPFEDYQEFLKRWYHLPARVIDHDPEFNLYEQVRAVRLEVESKKAEDTTSSEDATGNQNRSEV